MVVATLSVMFLSVGALAFGAVTSAAHESVIAPRFALGARTDLFGNTVSRAVAAADHDNSFWSRAEKGYSPRSGTSPAWWLQARRQPLHVQKLIYIYQLFACLSTNMFTNSL